MWHAPEQIDDHSAWLVECINEYSTATRGAAQELEKPLPTLSRGGPPEVAELSDSELIAVADSWFEVFRAAPKPMPSPVPSTNFWAAPHP